MKARLAVAAALGALLALAPVAQADYDPLGSGTTRLSLDRGFLALLRREGVKLSAVAPAKLRAGTVTFPVAGGKFDPTVGRGTVEHEGALLFKAGNRSIPLRALQLKTTRRHSPLSVKAGGSQLKLASARALAVSRQGFGEGVRVTGLTLGPKLATRLGKKLHLPAAFQGGQPLGASLTRAQPQTVALLGKGRASLVLDPGFAAKLSSLFVAVNPIFPAEHPGPFTLPIFDGTIAPDGSAGRLETKGSLELLQLGGGQVFWHEPWIDLAARSLSAEADVEPSPPYSGKVGRVPIAPLSLAGATVTPDPGARTVTVSGGALSLDAPTAEAFNEVFARPQGRDGVFVAGEAVGSIDFVAHGQ
jgi:hypothetical protein